MDPDPAIHVSNHHRRMLDQIFEHPVSHNVDWTRTVAMLGALGAIEERHDGKFIVTLGPSTEVFERPPGKDLELQQVLDLRRMLADAGFVESD